MSNEAIFTKFGGREEHCSHRAHGVCATPGGAAKKACEAEIKARMADAERFSIPDAESVWIFPNAVAAVSALRARSAARR